VPVMLQKHLHAPAHHFLIVNDQNLNSFSHGLKDAKAHSRECKFVLDTRQLMPF